MTTGDVKVVIFQHRLLHYRTRLFEILRARLNDVGVTLIVVHGQASPFEISRKDEGILTWSVKIKNRFVRLGGKDLLWQGFPVESRGAAMVILMQESRILSNYFWQLGGPLGGYLVAFWGHGKNYQSTTPNSMREKWKSFCLKRVNWWFTYTTGCATHIVETGFVRQHLTVLDNAIDVTGFTADLTSVSDAELAQARQQLGMAITSQVAIYCGSIYAEKRIALLLEAADLLHARLPDFHLIVVGDGPEASLVSAAAKTRAWLHVRGIRTGREKALDYRLSSVMLNPGLVGLHIVDSFVAQTPLVTQASAMHSPEYDYLVNGENGLSVAADSAASYAEAVATIFTQPGLLATMQANCARDAQRYTLERMSQNFVEGIVACLVQNGRLPASATVVASTPATVKPG